MRTSLSFRASALLTMTLLLQPSSGASQDDASEGSESSAGGVDAAVEVLGDGVISVDQSGDLIRLPFDRPFTLALALNGFEIGDPDPELRWKEFRNPLTEVPADVCSTGAQARLAGVAATGPATDKKSKARFIVGALEPNRYVVFCLSAEAQLGAELSPREASALAGSLRRSLASLESEIELGSLPARLDDFNRGLEQALEDYAKRMGLGGMVRLAKPIDLELLQEQFLDEREAVGLCDVEELLFRRNDFLGESATRWGEVVGPAIESGAFRVGMNECASLYSSALLSASQQDQLDGGLVDELQTARKSLLDLEPSLDAFARLAIAAMQQRNTLFLTATVPGSSAAMRYVSADPGFAFVPHLDQSVPYTGINIYLRPVNPPSLVPLGWGKKGFLRRTSFTLGLTLTDDLVLKETVSGTETVIVDDLTDTGSLLLGLGFRVNPALRIGAGAIAYRQRASLVDLDLETEVTFYFSLSLDLNVAKLFGGGKGGIFSGGSGPASP